MPFCKNHDHIYFDNLCRTKKAETVLSLIYATDQAKKHCKGDKSKEKEEIAKHLVSAYQLFKFDSGSYSGTTSQFQSQYTIGHELGIWKNSDLDLTPLAQKVADNKLTIREYFDIVFLNYVQPINNKIVHILATILEYAINNGLTTVSKEDIRNSFTGMNNKAENINAVYNMLIGTSYFSELSDCLSINYDPRDIYECCNLECLSKDYETVKREFDNLDVYLKYLLEDRRSEKLLIRRLTNGKESVANSSASKASMLVSFEPIPQELTVQELANILKEMYNTAQNRTTGIHMFGIKYAELIKNKGYTALELVKASGIGDNYHVEVSKGIRIYESILNNEFGITITSNKEAKLKEVDTFPHLSPRVNPKYPLNQILYGAPGTGKTYATAQYAVAILEDKDVKTVSAEPRSEVMNRYNNYKNSGRIVFTTFHQNYGYEDFIQGIRPDTSGKEMSFVEVDGVFKVIADRALMDKDNKYVLLIDEINRANISKTFGELITLIEDDKRWGENNALSIILPSGEPFAVPNNLYIVGTMNSADKSISLIDAALRRRFRFIEFVPNLLLIKDLSLRTVLEKLNKSIEKELNSTDLLVGHSYFINKSEDDIVDIMNHNIIPLLYEYFFDEKKKVEKTLSEALDGLDYKINSQEMGRVTISKKEG